MTLASAPQGGARPASANDLPLPAGPLGGAPSEPIAAGALSALLGQEAEAFAAAPEPGTAPALEAFGGLPGGGGLPGPGSGEGSVLAPRGPGGLWRTHNFEVEEHHTYVAGGVRVHNDSQDYIDLAEDLGRTFGSIYGNMLLDDESAFVRLAGSTALSAVTSVVAEAIAKGIFHPNTFDVSKILGEELRGYSANLQAAAVSSAGAFLTAELGEALGLEGFGEDLFNFVGTKYAGSFLAEMAQSGNPVEVMQNLKWASAWSEAGFGADIASFLGSALAREILPAETLEGSIGGSLGGIVGLSLAGKHLGMTLGNVLAPGVGAFVGTIVGTFLGNLFGDEPSTPDGVIDLWAQQPSRSGASQLVEVRYDFDLDEGFSEAYTKTLGDAAQALAESYVAAIGAVGTANRLQVERFEAKLVDGEMRFYEYDETVDDITVNTDVAAGKDGKFRVASAEAMLDGSVSDLILGLDPVGGNLLAKRAVAGTKAQDLVGISAALAAAAELDRYYEDREVINALIAAEPDSAFAAGWTVAFAHAEELDLYDLSPSDFNGGLAGWLGSLAEAGLAVGPSGVRVEKSGAQGLRIELDIPGRDAVPDMARLFADRTQVAEGGRELELLFDTRLRDVGYTEVTGAILRNGVYEALGDTAGRDLWFGRDDRGNHFVDEHGGEIQGDPNGPFHESSDDILIGGDKDDTVYAAGGWDWVDGGSGDDLLSGGGHDDVLLGGAGDDTLYGDGGNDYLEGGSGADELHGGFEDGAAFYGWGDTAGYTGSSRAMSVSLATGQGSGGDAQGDRLHGIRNLVGSAHADILTGNGADNVLEGGAGADRLSGGGGTDVASYARAKAGVVASLVYPTSRNVGDAAGDSYSGIEGLEGSVFDDVMHGNDGDNILWGGDGDDVLVAGLGRDRVVGGLGFDTLSYRDHGSAVTIDLLTPSASSAVVANDQHTEIEAFEGTRHADTLRGSHEADALMGHDGDDHIRGLGGDDALFGDGGADHLDGDSGNDVLDGGDGDDELLGDTDDDTLRGGAGDDDLKGDHGADVLRGDAGADVLFGGSGGDDLHGGSDDDRLYGGEHDDRLWGDAGDDVLPGSTGDDELHGGSGDDVIEGGSGRDVIRAGDGDDIVFYGEGDDFWGAGGAAIDVGEAGYDTLVIEEGSDFDTKNLAAYGFEAFRGADGDDEARGTRDGVDYDLDGGAGDDWLEGAGGDDVLRGGSGSDTLQGNAGDDTIHLDAADRLHWNSGGAVDVGGAGRDTVIVVAGSAFEVGDLAAHGVEVFRGAERRDVVGAGARAGAVDLDGGAGNDDLRGAGGDDALAGGQGDDWLEGGGGSDVLRGGSGRDTLLGGDGDDVIHIDADDKLHWNSGGAVDVGGAGRDTLVIEDGSAFVTGNIDQYGLEAFRGGDGDDRVEAVDARVRHRFEGGGGDDDLRGAGGDDELVGGSGDDRLYGRDGDDTLTGGTGADRLDGGRGTDTASYREAAARVVVDLRDADNEGEAAGDRFDEVENLEGSRHGDLLFGDDAANRLFGAGGNDRLYGRKGDDVLKGGTGADVFVFARNGDRDRVIDFENDLDTIQIDRDFAGVSTAADALARARQVGADVVFDFGGGDVLTVEGVTKGQLVNDLVVA